MSAVVSSIEGGTTNILLGVTGSVAAVKVPELICRLLDKFGSNAIAIKLVLTQGGKNFWEKASTYDAVHWNKIQHLLERECEPRQDGDIIPSSRIQVYYGADEWKVWNKMGDPVEHIAMRDWATVCLVAPLSAHSLAKFANGLCDDTLSCIVRAWNFGPSGKPLILAPAMNVAMWEHPITAQQLNQIVGFGITSDKDESCVHVISPQEKMLACGEVGIGAMADVSLIVDTVSLLLHPRLST